ncbi:SPOR domain-containing protein [Stutzerimonas stutzeri]|uniref:SPOR domain-containing protein n=1 Tax=Stutzerimonas sp. S1 TaxID=3030652 RepID=UPI002223F092|nr:SPOR domain-containing protein [Stutzerimonas sp. S1]MCW3150885.1 SPOR domain-containing protein [Stutzerimonas sp. S1]
MRWVFLSLLVLNILYFVFQQQAPLQVKRVESPMTYSPAGARIALLSESVVEPREQTRLEAGEGEVCLFLGGFDEEETVRVLEQRLLSLDIQVSLQLIEFAAGVDYWVYLPPLASRQASLRQLRELQSRNIDSYIITVGDLANGISLGIFSRKDSAEGVVARLRDVDYAALVRELPRMHRKQWLRVEPESRELLGGALLQALVRDMPSLQHRQMPCASIATSGRFD